MASASTLVLAAALIGSFGTAGCEEHPERAATATAPAVRVPAPPVSPPVARLAHVTGDVRVKRAGSSQWVPIQDRATLAAEDVVQAMDSGSAEIVMQATGATIALRSATTVQIPRPAAEPLRVSGRMVVRVSATTSPAELRLRLPPGVLVLRAEPGREPVVEASVDVSATRSAVDMVEGTATVTPSSGNDISLGRRAWIRFRADGSLEDRGVAGPTPTLLAPLSEETVRTTGLVDLSWEPLDGANGYAVEIRAKDTVHRVESRRATIRTRFATGDYEWTVRGQQDGAVWPAAPPRALHVVVDDRPPDLVVSEPVDHAKVTGPTVRFAGQTEPAAVVTIGAVRCQADARGQFSLDVGISQGLSNLVIRVRDDLGNERRMSRSLVWE